VTTAVELAGRADEITDDLSLSLGMYAEPALAEYQSFARVIGYLAKAGFEIEAGIGGVPTALCATAGGGQPVLGIYAGMNADRQTGHSHGHNLETAAAVAAAVALKETLRELSLPGTVTLLLYPANEALDAGAAIAAAGDPGDLDVLIMAQAGALNRGGPLSAEALRVAGCVGAGEAMGTDSPAKFAGYLARLVPTVGFTFAAWAPGTVPGSAAAEAQSVSVDGAEQAWWMAKALSALGMRLLTDAAAVASVNETFQSTLAEQPASGPPAAIPPDAFPEAPGVTVRSDGMVRFVARVSPSGDYVMVPEPLVKVVLGAYDCGV
jgi:hypothetical protein